jgi:hypothetical protein
LALQADEWAIMVLNDMASRMNKHMSTIVGFDTLVSAIATTTKEATKERPLQRELAKQAHKDEYDGQYAPMKAKADRVMKAKVAKVKKIKQHHDSIEDGGVPKTSAEVTKALELRRGEYIYAKNCPGGEKGDINEAKLITLLRQWITSVRKNDVVGMDTHIQAQHGLEDKFQFSDRAEATNGVLVPRKSGGGISGKSNHIKAASTIKRTPTQLEAQLRFILDVAVRTSEANVLMGLASKTEQMNDQTGESLRDRMQGVWIPICRQGTRIGIWIPLSEFVLYDEDFDIEQTSDIEECKELVRSKFEQMHK